MIISQRNNEFTFNYRKVDIMTQSFVPVGGENYIHKCPVIQIHISHPWEMLGFTVKPTWWESEYGAGSHTVII